MTVRHFDPEGAHEAVAATLLRKVVQGLLKPVLSPRFAITTQRRWAEALTVLSLPLRSVQVQPARVGGVAGEWLRHGEPARRGTLLFLHGGAYCIGSPRTHRALTTRLARCTGMAVFAADYRLAPEHPYPAAVDDAVAVVRALREQGLGPVVIAGDSAGGGLAALTALALRDSGEAVPEALVLMSPWADLSLATAPAEPPAGEAMLSHAWGRACSAHFVGTADARQASPLQADLRGLPPTLIQCGSDELLHNDAVALHGRMQAAGVDVQLEVTRRRWHVFQLHTGVMPSADQALQRVAGFVATRLGDLAGHVHEVLILSAGMSGLCMGIQLKQANRHDFLILEKSAGLGGTWWDNRYPGAHVDVPSPLYSFSFEPNPRWTRRFAAAPEIQAYMTHCAAKYGLQPHLRLNTAIESAQFDEAQACWVLTLSTGQQLRGRHFVCSTGPLNQARWPDIPGLARFAGQRLHSARWDAGVALAGRRVGVIGTGSTASQLTSPIAERAAHLTVFQRTANWVLPRIDRPYNAVDRLLARLPPYARAARAFWYALLEWGRRGFDEGTVARRGMLRTAAMHRRRQIADPTLREKLVPPYPLGCKRIIYSNDFYPALARPNVTLETTAIREITERGIVTADGREHALDVLVCATGFDTTHLLASLEVRGRGGVLLSQAWASGPAAYRGMMVPGFPNLYFMLGPNTGTGHTSTLLYIEPQVRFVLAAMRRLDEQRAAMLSVRPEVHAAHNAALQARLEGSVWSLCRSWYRTDSGKITALWPGFTAEYVRGLEQVRWDDYAIG